MVLHFVKSKKDRIHEIIINPALVKYCLITALLVFSLSLSLGIIAANLADPALNGFIIFRNYINDLGSFRHTSIPHFLDLGTLITSFCLFPVVFYFKTILYSSKESKVEFSVKKVLKRLLSNCALIAMIFGLLGILGVGFFSEDLSKHISNYYGINPFEDTVFRDFHNFFVYLFFTSILLSGIFIGSYFIIFPTDTAECFDVDEKWTLSTFLGSLMLVWPLVHWINSFSPIAPSEQFYEWFIFLTILSWVLPLMLLLLRKLIKTTKISQQNLKDSPKRRIYSKLTNPKLVKYTIIIGVPYILLTIIFGYLIAQLDLPGYSFMPYAKHLEIVGTDLAGYNIFNDVISNLGSYRYTPIPQIFNFGIMIFSFLLIPSVFFIHNLLSGTKSKGINKNFKSEVKRYLIISSTVGLIIGILSLFGIGFFSLDVAKYLKDLFGTVILGLDWHTISTVIFTISMTWVSIFIGILFIFFNPIMVKAFDSKIRPIIFYILGIEMLIVIPIFFAITMYFLTSFLEWMFLLLICAWLIPFLLILLIPLNATNSCSKKRFNDSLNQKYIRVNRL